MTSQYLLVSVLTVSYITLSTGNHDNPTTGTYPARVFTTTQGECLSDLQHEMVIAEVRENVRNILIRKWLATFSCQIRTDSTL